MPLSSRSGRIALLSLAFGFAVATVSVAAPRRAFVTSSAGNGKLSTWAETNLDGLAGGDEICQYRAAHAAVPLPNASSFRAWLSTATTDAYCHLYGFDGNESPTCGGNNPNLNLMGPWVRTDGEPFAGTFAQVVGTAHEVYQPILLDEDGDEVFGDIWTGTTENGVELTGFTCTNWTTTSGNGGFGVSHRVGRPWTYNSNVTCTDLKHLLCLEAGSGDPIDFPAAAGAIAFVTSTKNSSKLSNWAETDSDGLAGADEICRTRAAAGFLPNSASFFAFLSDSTTDAIDRVTYGGPFVRVDGFVFADSKSALVLPGLAVRTGLNVTESGHYLGTSADFAWTGTGNDGNRSGGNCSNWSVSAFGIGTAIMGGYNDIESGWIQSYTNDCSNSERLYCFSNQEVLFWDNFESGSARRWSQTVN